jgi:hypothetical protein
MNDYCLAGTYFDRESADHSNTCKVRFLEDDSLCKLAFTLSCRDGFRIERFGHHAHRETSGKEGSRVVTEMRNKLAGIVLETELISREPDSHIGGEIILATFHLSARRQSGQLASEDGVKPGESTQPVLAHLEIGAGRRSRSAKSKSSGI